MLSLSQITKETRQVLKYGGIGLGVLIGLLILVKGVVFLWGVAFPTPPPPPTQEFGKLPAIVFPNTSGQQDLQYDLNTITGTLPSFPDRLPVLKLVQNQPNLLALQDVRKTLASVGFTINETQLSPTDYQWANSDGSLIKYNILTNNFSIQSNYLYTPPAQPKQMPDKSQIAEFPLSYLKHINEDTSDINTDLTTVTYFNIQNGKLLPTENTVNAIVARVDLFQNNIPVNPFIAFKDIIKELPVYYPDTNGSSMNFLLEPLDFDFKVVGSEFHHQTINTSDPTLSATYPIKSAQEAYNDLKRGNAYVVYNGKNSTIEINDISLGYYAGDGNNQYLMPIVIFKGDGFQAYVSAVADSSIGN